MPFAKRGDGCGSGDWWERLKATSRQGPPRTNSSARRRRGTRQPFCRLTSCVSAWTVWSWKEVSRVAKCGYIWNAMTSARIAWRWFMPTRRSPPLLRWLANLFRTILPEAAIFLGSVALVPFGMPGTDEMRHTIRPFLADHKTFLLSNHGAVALGKDVSDAAMRMETLERVANVIYHAHQLGTPQPLPDHAFSKLLEIGLSGRLD